MESISREIAKGNGFQERKENEIPECPQNVVGAGSWDLGHRTPGAPGSGGP